MDFSNSLSTSLGQSPQTGAGSAPETAGIVRLWGRGSGETLMWTVVESGPNFGAGTGERPWVELENLA